MDIAETVSSRATCDRLHVGCVIVKNKKIISTGYNGSVSSHEQCDEVGHLYNNQGRCVRTIHAEQNAILYANRHELIGATVYVTHYPCENCAKLLVQSGIKKVVYKHPYENVDSNYFLDMIEAVHLQED
jgi:dCMP deaminase